MIANKNDLVNYRVVSEQDSRDQATMYGLRILSISATNDSAETVKHCYDTLIREIVRKRALNNNASPPKNIQDFTNKPPQSPRRQKDSNSNRANSNAVANGPDQDQQQTENQPAGRIRANATTTNQKNMKRTKSFFSLRFITTLFKDDKKKSEENKDANTNNNTNQRETKSEEEKKTGENEKDCIIS